MHLLKIKILLIFLGIRVFAFAQTQHGTRANPEAPNKAVLDSIEILLKKGKEACITNCELGIQYSIRALKLAVKIHNLSEMAKAYNSIGIAYKLLGKYSKSLEYQLKSLNAQISLGDKKGIARASNNVSLVYSLQNDFLKALEYQLRSLKIKEEIGDEEGLAISYENLGRIYSDQKNSPKALEYFMKAYSLNKKVKDTVGLVFDYVTIGNEYLIIKNYYLAKVNLEEALKLKELRNSMDKETSDIYNSLADLNAEIGNVDVAIELYKKTLELNLKFKNKRNIAISYLNIGDLLCNMKKNIEAET